MDLQEFEQSVLSVIRDENSTTECKLRLEKSLAAIEKRKPEYLKNHLKTAVKHFESALMTIVIREYPDSGYAQKLRTVCSAMNSISKEEAATVVSSIRALLRQNIPELATEDQKPLIDLGESALDSKDPVILAHALKEIRCTENPCAELAFVACKIAIKLNDRTATEAALNQLSRHIDDPYYLRKYIFNARKTGNLAALKKAKEYMENKLDSDVIWTLYATTCRALRDIPGIARAMKHLITRFHDPICLTTYAALAKDRGNQAEMAYALEKLEPHLDDPKCLSIYATLARHLNDTAAMERVHERLEAASTRDIVCLIAYAKNSKTVGGPDSQRKAMMGLKPHLDDPLNMDLYIEVAESQK